MSDRLETLLRGVDPALVDKLVPLSAVREVLPDLLGGANAGTSTIYKWPELGLELIGTNGNGTGRKFTTRRWLLEFWCRD